MKLSTLMCGTGTISSQQRLLQTCVYCIIFKVHYYFNNPVHFTIVIGNGLRELKPVKDPYTDMAFAQCGYLGSFSDIHIRTQGVFLPWQVNNDTDLSWFQQIVICPIKNIHLEQTLNWHFNHWLNCWKYTHHKEDHRSGKAIQPVNHTHLPQTQFASQQRQYLKTSSHVFAQELSYRINANKYYFTL